MIRLIRPDKPKKLAEQETVLTNEFLKDNKKTVWKKEYIQKPLLEMTNYKCSYCERAIGKNTGQDVHIDHFKYKNKYKELVVDWNNLLPSCAQCNRNKGTHDTVEQPIINPAETDPRDYLFISQYRYYSKDARQDSIGRRTLDVLLLNDSDDCCIVRFKLGNELAERVEDLYNITVDKGEELKTDTATKNKVISGCRKLLKKCLPTEEYSAFMATSLHTDNNFLALKDALIKLELWDEELTWLFDISKNSVYDIHR